MSTPTGSQGGFTALFIQRSVATSLIMLAVGARVAQDIAIDKGLQGGEKVVLSPGMKVKAVS